MPRTALEASSLLGSASKPSCTQHAWVSCTLRHSSQSCCLRTCRVVLHAELGCKRRPVCSRTGSMSYSAAAQGICAYERNSSFTNKL